MNNRKFLKDQITELITVPESYATVYYFDEGYHIIRDGKPTEITKAEAVRSLKNGELWHIMEDKRYFDMESSKWIGTEPVHTLPAGLPKSKIHNITIAYPFTVFLEQFKTLTNRQGEFSR